MDIKQHKIKNLFFHIFYILIITLVASCFIPNKEKKRSLTKSVSIDENFVLTIILDNTNMKKKIGDVDNIELNGAVRLGIDDAKTTETEILITTSITNVKDCFYDDEKCQLKVAWPGGRLLIFSHYKNSKFVILNESYVNRI